jgi:ferredoxin-NADP reductase
MKTGNTTNSVRHKIKTLEVMVAEVIEETPETTTLVLFTGNDQLEYQPGHFLTIDPHQFEALERWVAYLEYLKGKREPPRAYSLASSPDEKYLAITIKEERYQPGVTPYPPLLSPILAKRSTRGLKMTITGFTGPYTLPPEDRMPAEILHICAGSGIVPNWSILKFTLRNYPAVKHTLIYSNKTWRDTIYRNQLLELQAQFPEQFRLVFTVTRETPPDGIPVPVKSGRIDRQILAEELRRMDDPVVYVCGPAISSYEKKAARKEGTAPAPRFMESVLQCLAELGVERSRIRRESYG